MGPSAINRASWYKRPLEATTRGKTRWSNRLRLEHRQTNVQRLYNQGPHPTRRGWRSLIGIARRLYVDDAFGVDLNETIYVLVATIKKRLDIDASLYTILQVLSVTVFEKTALLQMLREAERTDKNHPQNNQLNLFNY